MVELEKFHDVRMVKFLEDLDLVLEADELFMGAIFFSDDLHRSHLSI